MTIEELWLTHSHKIDTDIPEKYMDEDDFQIAMNEYSSYQIKLIEDMQSNADKLYGEEQDSKQTYWYTLQEVKGNILSDN